MSDIGEIDLSLPDDSAGNSGDSAQNGSEYEQATSSGAYEQTTSSSDGWTTDPRGETDPTVTLNPGGTLSSAGPQGAPDIAGALANGGAPVVSGAVQVVAHSAPAAATGALTASAQAMAVDLALQLLVIDLSGAQASEDPMSNPGSGSLTEGLPDLRLADAGQRKGLPYDPSLFGRMVKPGEGESLPPLVFDVPPEASAPVAPPPPPRAAAPSTPSLLETLLVLYGELPDPFLDRLRTSDSLGQLILAGMNSRAFDDVLATVVGPPSDTAEALLGTGGASGGAPWQVPSGIPDQSFGTGAPEGSSPTPLRWVPVPYNDLGQVPNRDPLTGQLRVPLEKWNHTQDLGWAPATWVAQAYYGWGNVGVDILNTFAALPQYPGWAFEKFGGGSSIDRSFLDFLALLHV